MDLVLLNLGQVMKTTPELVSASPNYRTTQTRKHRPHAHGGSSVSSFTRTRTRATPIASSGPQRHVSTVT
ncbi:hypothetical protein TNCV_247221 [Trichonephila clavipes]|nr:hypothetical protein TNCV_247221 [Trichonephila clavipes]